MQSWKGYKKMLINVRDSENNLKVKDILDLDFDMLVEEDKREKERKIYKIMVNPNLTLDEVFYDKTSAEKRMLGIADARNELENELRNF